MKHQFLAQHAWGVKLIFCLIQKPLAWTYCWNFLFKSQIIFWGTYFFCRLKVKLNSLKIRGNHQEVYLLCFLLLSLVLHVSIFKDSAQQMSTSFETHCCSFMFLYFDYCPLNPIFHYSNFFHYYEEGIFILSTFLEMQSFMY